MLPSPVSRWVLPLPRSRTIPDISARPRRRLDTSDMGLTGCLRFSVMQKDAGSRFFVASRPSDTHRIFFTKNPDSTLEICPGGCAPTNGCEAEAARRSVHVFGGYPVVPAQRSRACKMALEYRSYS